MAALACSRIPACSSAHLFFQVFDDVEVVIAVITLEFQRVGVVDEGGGGPFGVIIEAIVRSAEVFLRGGGGIHKAHVLAGLGQRIERNVRGFARTGPKHGSS